LGRGLLTVPLCRP